MVKKRKISADKDYNVLYANNGCVTLFNQLSFLCAFLLSHQPLLNPFGTIKHYG
uniref:Uncharacterized protein n=1 Tax=Tetranychus urticae TaxID=32264 RepID=T1KGA7_TETUR